jgi:hypothetical protein
MSLLLSQTPHHRHCLGKIQFNIFFQFSVLLSPIFPSPLLLQRIATAFTAESLFLAWQTGTYVAAQRFIAKRW